MAKTKEVKTNKKIDKGRIFVKVMSFILAILMVLGVAATLIYYLVTL